MAVFFTSDTHFGDHRTLNIHKRPFCDVNTMDAEIERLWNLTIAPGDDVWHLGDFARTGARTSQIFGRLNGRKRLLVGNNDDAATLDLPWEWVGPYRELDLGGRFFVLCHYPFRSWNRQHKQAINLHGHSHGKLKSLSRQLDVGVDAHGFQPVPLEQIMAKTRSI